jgi:hypothetical protein
MVTAKTTMTTNALSQHEKWVTPIENPVDTHKKAMVSIFCLRGMPCPVWKFRI